jgi:hypothetical protein
VVVVAEVQINRDLVVVAGGFRTSYPGGTQIELDGGATYTVTVGGKRTVAVLVTNDGGNGGDSEIYINAPAVAIESTGGGGGGGGNSYSR